MVPKVTLTAIVPCRRHSASTPAIYAAADSPAQGAGGPRYSSSFRQHCLLNRHLAIEYGLRLSGTSRQRSWLRSDASARIADSCGLSFHQFGSQADPYTRSEKSVSCISVRLSTCIA